ncbi:MAG: MmcQ/YjbR family DNA-binding protein [Dehalococcoidia bacterium]
MISGHGLLQQVRAIGQSLPEATEKPEGRPTFQVRQKTFAMFMDDHHGDGRVAIWCKAPLGAQDILVGADPDRFFVPPYVGPHGWIGIRLDVATDVNDWGQVADLVADSYRMTAPKRLRAAFDQLREARV